MEDKEESREEVGAFWKRKSKKDVEYYSGKIQNEENKTVDVFGYLGAPRGEEKHDVVVFVATPENEDLGESVGGFHIKAKDDGEAYLVGNVFGRKLVGWKNQFKKDGDKRPNVRLYVSSQPKKLI